MQTAGTPGDVHANLAELDRAAADAVARGASLLITPEMFLTGYEIGPAAADLARQDLDGPTGAIAARHGIDLVVGLPEADGDRLYNTASVFAADGALTARYRKTHLFGDLDRAVFTAGDELVTTFEHRGLKVALLVCYDVEFPETVRAAALAGAHLVAVPTAQMEPFSFVADVLIRTRAWENQVYVAYVNHDGDEGGELRYVGGSSLVAPDGAVLDRAAHGTALLVADLRRDVVEAGQRANPYLLDRRPPHAPVAAG
nr:carbon-nitrogen hydrolase family protein [Patulibacter sp. SYSU D01012]